MKMSQISNFDIKDYRQPTVTSVGIIIGFLLGFLGQWVTEDTFALKSLGDMLTFVGSILGVIALLVALFRMLAPRENSQEALAAYRGILKLYAFGVVIPLVCMLLSAFL